MTRLALGAKCGCLGRTSYLAPELAAQAGSSKEPSASPPSPILRRSKKLRRESISRTGVYRTWRSQSQSIVYLSIDINKLVRAQQRLAQIGVDPFRSGGWVHVHVPAGLLLEESQQPVHFGTRGRS